MKIRWCAWCLVGAACQPPAMTPTVEPTPPVTNTTAPTAAPTAAPPPPAPPATPTAKATTTGPKPDLPPPPLSSPNPIVDGGTAKAADATAPLPPPATLEEAVKRSGEAAMQCSDGAPGTLVLRVTITPKGEVRQLSVVRGESTPALQHGAFETCVLAAVKQQRFPARATEGVVDVPITLSASDDGGGA